ncbi:hypothetical protein [Gluconobacter kanchanaburiensis]|uniref:hypothetical protein n=1 Tax=Gluconobacter kanchanaburiensis TaxID=563199 RepID=UPI0011BEEF4A|nr:hypothetical protein [Gluconobacter kanchanaburiensis]MBF0861583.1 hypothetical protein [Gluconobacter kanchanaburiensis]
MPIYTTPFDNHCGRRGARTNQFLGIVEIEYQSLDNLMVCGSICKDFKPVDFTANNTVPAHSDHT